MPTFSTDWAGFSPLQRPARPEALDEASTGVEGLGKITGV
jgi:hypothetical protein